MTSLPALAPPATRATFPVPGHHWARVGPWQVHARTGRPAMPEGEPPEGSPSSAPRGTPGLAPIVLVHGYVISSRYMLPTLRRLAARGHEVWAPDLPGHGRSDTPARALDVGGCADALAAWMDAVGVHRAIAVGNSLGCQVVARVALQYPGLLAGAVLVAPTVDPRARTARQQGWRLLCDVPAERASLPFLEFADMLRVGPWRMAAMARAALDDRIEDALPALRGTPTLVVRGERDPLVPDDWAVLVARLAGAPPALVVPGAPHGVNYSTPEALTYIVDTFARSLA